MSTKLAYDYNFHPHQLGDPSPVLTPVHMASSSTPTHFDILHKVLQHGMLPATDTTGPQQSSQASEPNKQQYGNYLYPHQHQHQTTTAAAISAYTSGSTQAAPDCGPAPMNNRTNMSTPPPPTLIPLPQPTSNVSGMVAGSIGEPMPFTLTPPSTVTPASFLASKPAKFQFDDLAQAQFQTRKHYGSMYATNELNHPFGPEIPISNHMPHHQHHPHHHHHHHHHHPNHRYSTYTPICFLHEAQQHNQQQPADAKERKYINNTNINSNMGLKNSSGSELPGASVSSTTAKLSLTEQSPKSDSSALPHQSMANKRHSLHIDSYLTTHAGHFRSGLGANGVGNCSGGGSDVRSSNEKLLSYSYYTNLNYEKVAKSSNRPKLLTLNNEPSAPNSSSSPTQSQSCQQQQQNPKPKTINVTSFGALVGSINKERKSKSINNVSTPMSTVGTASQITGSSNVVTSSVAASLGSNNTLLQSTNQTANTVATPNKTHHQESPLYQKIMSRLSELPDSVLLRNYASSNPGNLQAVAKTGETKSNSTTSTSGVPTRTFASTIDENLKMNGHATGSDKIIKLAPSIFQPPMKPTTSMTSNMSAATTSAATNVTAPPTIGAPLDQYVQKQQPQNTTNTQTNRMSAATTPTPIQMQTGAPQPSGANAHYTTTSLPAMRITQKSLKAYAKGNLIVLKKPDPTPSKPSDPANGNKYISTIRITSANTVAETAAQLRGGDFNNPTVRENRRYKHKSMYLEPAFGAAPDTQKTSVSIKEAGLRSITPANIIDVSYNERTRTEPPDGSANKTSIYIEPSRTPVPFNSLNSTCLSKPATYRIQDLVFRDEELNMDKKSSADQQGSIRIASNNSTNEKTGNKLSLTNAFSLDKELNLNSAFSPAFLTNPQKQSISVVDTKTVGVHNKHSTNPPNQNQISFANFKLSNAQNTREFLANTAFNREKNCLKNKRFSQLIDNETFDYNRNHPLIDNLIIHVENNKEINKMGKEQALQEIAKLTKYEPNSLVATITGPKFLGDNSKQAEKKKDSMASNEEKRAVTKTPVFELTRNSGDTKIQDEIKPQDPPRENIKTSSNSSSNRDSEMQANPAPLAQSESDKKSKSRSTTASSTSKSNSSNNNNDESKATTTATNKTGKQKSCSSSSSSKGARRKTSEMQTNGSMDNDLSEATQNHTTSTQPCECTEEIERAATFGQSSNDEDENSLGSSVEDDDDDENELLDSFRKVDLKKFDVKNISFVPIDAINNTAKILSNYPVHYGPAQQPPPQSTSPRLTAPRRTPPPISARPTSKTGEPIFIKQITLGSKSGHDGSGKHSSHSSGAELKVKIKTRKDTTTSVNDSTASHIAHNHAASSDVSENGDVSVRSSIRPQYANNSTSEESCPNFSSKPNSHRSKNDSSSGGDHASEEIRGMRKISTPPPLPHILDNLAANINGNNKPNSATIGAAKFNRLLINQTEVNKLEAMGQQHQSSGTRSGGGSGGGGGKQSITSSIREAAGREKPVRMNHGLPPPPPVVVVSTLPGPNSNPNRHSLNGTPVPGLNSNEQLTSVGKITSAEKSRKQASTPLNGHSNKTGNTGSNSPNVNGERYESRPKSTHIETTYGKKSAPGTPKTYEHPMGNNLIKMSKKEDKGNNSTNLPQLDRIDYVLRTNDEKILTNITPYTEEKKPSNKPRSHHVTSSAVKALVQFPNETSRKNKQPAQPQHQYQYHHPINNYYVPDHRAEYMNNHHSDHHSPLPWSLKDSKNGKNFYENYARENDRRKREGNGFLMLLPGIAIPIDTDAGDSDDASSSN